MFFFSAGLLLLLGHVLRQLQQWNPGRCGGVWHAVGLFLHHFSLHGAVRTCPHHQVGISALPGLKHNYLTKALATSYVVIKGKEKCIVRLDNKNKACLYSLHSMANFFKSNYVLADTASSSAWQLLCSWDFSLINERAVRQRKNNLRIQLKVIMTMQIHHMSEPNISNPQYFFS